MSDDQLARALWALVKQISLLRQSTFVVEKRPYGERSDRIFIVKVISPPEKERSYSDDEYSK